jgi:phenylpropionate dioxygenase-like ring-hydroxylating dioxygenase large terminal subunit
MKWATKLIKSPKIETNQIVLPTISEDKTVKISIQDVYDLNWYVIGYPSDFTTHRPVKRTIWGRNYVIWKTLDENNNYKYNALDDACTHRGASLSTGNLNDGCATCPYHGYEYNSMGELSKVPGLENFQSSYMKNTKYYHVIEKNGWIFLNISPFTKSENSREILLEEHIFEEKEVSENMSVTYTDLEYDCYSRLVSENSLDIMHIAFVHTFGNSENPSPIFEIPPTKLNDHPNHYKTVYIYESGKHSITNKVYGMKHIKVETEFVLPHTTIARVIFGEYINTVVTFATPIDTQKTRLYVKTYRNYWRNGFGDIITRYLMDKTMLEDKSIIETIDPSMMDGNFNMKYDKLQNTYKTQYKKLIHQYEL